MMQESSATLDAIATRAGTDKASGGHGYTRHYAQMWDGCRDQVLAVCELGVLLGQSLLTWQEYFRNAVIVGVDVNLPPQMDGERIKLIAGDVRDSGTANTARSAAGREFDIVIDDASHVNTHQFVAFEHFWPTVKPGGWYVIEDLHTSYWGTAYNHGRMPSIVEWLKRKIDELQLYGDYGNAAQCSPRGVWGLEVQSLTFYRGLVVVRKAQ